MNIFEQAALTRQTFSFISDLFTFRSMKEKCFTVTRYKIYISYLYTRS